MQQVVVLLNHLATMMDQGKISVTDYHYPIVQFFKYTHLGSMTGAQNVSRSKDSRSANGASTTEPTGRAGRKKDSGMLPRRGF